MKNSIIAALAALAAFVGMTAEVEPQYEKFDRIKGGTLIMVNTEEFVVGKVEEAKSEMSTNSTEAIERMAAEVAAAATNYTDSILADDTRTFAGKAMSAAAADEAAYATTAESATSADTASVAGRSRMLYNPEDEEHGITYEDVVRTEAAVAQHSLDIEGIQSKDTAQDTAITTMALSSTNYTEVVSNRLEKLLKDYADSVGTAAEGHADTLNSEMAQLVTNITDTINAVIGEDSGLTMREVAAEEVAEIVAGADASYDTLKEIADWIMNDTTGAAQMANDIAALKIDKADYSEMLDIAAATARNSTNYTDTSVLALKAEVQEQIEELSLREGGTEIPEEAADKGITYVDSYGEDANVAIELGRNAKAAVTEAAIEGASSNTVIRSVSIAIGAESDARVSESSTKNQAIAIGWHAQAKASNAIAIGSGAEHPTETAETGNATVASGSTSIAMGYDAKATAESTIAIGRSAKATVIGAAQIGQGTNSKANTLQFKGYTIVDSDGQIPTERLLTAADMVADVVMSAAERIYKNGNMTVKMDGSEEQSIEPMVNGLSEIIFESTNGTYLAGTECGIEPPLGTRNYNILITEIPHIQAVTNGVPYDLPPSSNFMMAVGETLVGKKVTLDVSPSIGFKTSETMIAVTNAPCIAKVREPSTNSVIIVVKPFTADDL